MCEEYEMDISRKMAKKRRFYRRFGVLWGGIYLLRIIRFFWYIGSVVTNIFISQSSPNISNTAVGIITMPAKSWKNFSAVSVLASINSTAVMHSLKILHITATGMLDKSRTAFWMRERFIIYDINAATMMNDVSILRPLHASSTAIVVCPFSVTTFPS